MIPKDARVIQVDIEPEEIGRGRSIELGVAADCGEFLRQAIAAARGGEFAGHEAWLEQLLESLGVASSFDVRVISGVEGMEKPDPAIFRLALDRAGVQPQESVYVGDNPDFDTRPAEDLGMLAVLIDRRGRFADHSGLRITTLDDLPSVIGLER